MIEMGWTWQEYREQPSWLVAALYERLVNRMRILAGGEEIIEI